MALQVSGGHSSVGRALAWHARGREFESRWLHLVRLVATSGGEAFLFPEHVLLLPSLLDRCLVYLGGIVCRLIGMVWLNLGVKGIWGAAEADESTAVSRA